MADYDIHVPEFFEIRWFYIKDHLDLAIGLCMSRMEISVDEWNVKCWDEGEEAV